MARLSGQAGAYSASAFVLATGPCFDSCKLCFCALASFQRYSTKKREMYRVLIMGQANLNAFAEQDRLRVDNEARSAPGFWSFKRRRAFSKSDYVPFLAEYVRANASQNQQYWLSRHNFDRAERLTATLPRLQQALPAADFVERLARSNYLFEQVASIEDAGVQRVYSLRVDSECHSFVANGFVNHNTEARLRAIAEELLLDIDKETVNFIPNYDEKAMEPTVLPSRVPNMLLNGATGIAVGMATNIPPHNLAELTDAVTSSLTTPTPQ